MSATEEKTESKPFDSEYYKWSKQISESKKVLIERLGVDISPTKIESSPVEEPTPSHTLTCSAWNKAGTWEECDFSKWAKSRIPEIFKAAELKSGDYTIKFPSVEKCDGQATYVFVKGKKRPGFDFNLKIKWTASSESEEDDASGYIVIDDFSDMSDGDYEWAFKTYKSDANHSKARSAVQSCKKDILKLLDSWINEFKNL